jgi:hypothetical protein
MTASPAAGAGMGLRLGFGVLLACLLQGGPAAADDTAKERLRGLGRIEGKMFGSIIAGRRATTAAIRHWLPDRTLRIVCPNGHLGFAPIKTGSFRTGCHCEPDLICAALSG